jgi:hypothetical protein
MRAAAKITAGAEVEELGAVVLTNAEYVQAHLVGPLEAVEQLAESYCPAEAARARFKESRQKTIYSELPGRRCFYQAGAGLKPALDFPLAVANLWAYFGELVIKYQKDAGNRKNTIQTIYLSLNPKVSIESLAIRLILSAAKGCSSS